MGKKEEQYAQHSKKSQSEFRITMKEPITFLNRGIMKSTLCFLWTMEAGRQMEKS